MRDYRKGETFLERRVRSIGEAIEMRLLVGEYVERYPGFIARVMAATDEIIAAGRVALNVQPPPLIVDALAADLRLTESMTDEASKAAILFAAHYTAQPLLKEWLGGEDFKYPGERDAYFLNYKAYLRAVADSLGAEEYAAERAAEAESPPDDEIIPNEQESNS